MTTYAIGDVQGCWFALEKLLQKINFNAKKDTLWFTGDLVNRGPHSLETLRFIKSLGDKHRVVLGNHDLHLLTVFYNAGKLHKGDTLDEILHAPDKIELIDWLRFRPILHYDENLKYVMVHAGLAPKWSLQLARKLANEVEEILRSDNPSLFFKNLYGNEPNQWQDNLRGMDRLRCIINFFTRMRFCHEDGSLELAYKGKIENAPQHLIPWFKVVNRINANEKIVFGHWAALSGITDIPNLYPLDTGCVWGNCLTALRLEDEQRFSVKCEPQ